MPQSIEEAASELAATFATITGLAPRVTIMGRDEKGRVVITACYRGDELVRAMQIEAFVIESGDSIRHRSQLKDGNTILVFQTERKKRR